MGFVSHCKMCFDLLRNVKMHQVWKMSAYDSAEKCSQCMLDIDLEEMMAPLGWFYVSYNSGAGVPRLW